LEIAARSPAARRRVGSSRQSAAYAKIIITSSYNGKRRRLERDLPSHACDKLLALDGTRENRTPLENGARALISDEDREETRPFDLKAERTGNGQEYRLSLV
jgi:hypothetical protein